MSPSKQGIVSPIHDFQETLMIEQLFTQLHSLDESAIAQVLEQQYQSGLPEDSLGRLSDIIIKLASHQKSTSPQITKPWITLFTDHKGVANEVPSIVNALAKTQNIPIDVVDVGTQQAPMTESQLFAAISQGMQAADKAKAAGADLFITGETGTNTTSAIAMVSVLSGKPAEELMCLGRERLMRRQQAEAELIQSTIEQHQEHLTSPLRILQYLGDLETAALFGAYIRATQLGMTIVVDSFMGTVALWIADMVSRNDQLVECDSVEALMELGKYSVPETMFCICGTCTRLVEWSFFAQLSDNPIHGWVLDALAVEPLLSLNMNIGQATGSTLTLPLIQQACEIQNYLNTLNQ